MWTSSAAVALALAVAFGAFGAHALKSRLDEYLMGVYEKAVLYHFIHALGLLIVPILSRVGVISAAAVNPVCSLLLAGILFFSGSLYLLALTGTRFLGAITPIGGVAFLAAWLLLAYAAIKGPQA